MPKELRIVERTNEDELSNEKHEETAINLGKGGFRFSHELLLIWLDFISIHILHLLGREGSIFLGIVLNNIWLGIKLLSLSRRNDHENRIEAGGCDSYV